MGATAIDTVNKVGAVPSTNYSVKLLDYYKNEKRSGRLPLGFGCEVLPEDTPTYVPKGCEFAVANSEYNARIIVGKDCPGHEFTGAGGLGQTQCAAIDLVAGGASATIMKNLAQYHRLSKEKQQSEEGRKHIFDEQKEITSNWFDDAARVYITQRAIHVDKYLGFRNEVGSNPTDLSAVVIKADCARIVGRESVRIYAGPAKTPKFPDGGERRSNNTKVINPKIELIAGGNEEDMQPVVLGTNLVKYLKKINDTQNKAIFKVIQQMCEQITSNSTAIAVASMGSGSGLAINAVKMTIDSMNTMFKKVMDEAIQEINHLNYAGIPGQYSILSSKVFTT
jgi:hypothetical protein